MQEDSDRLLHQAGGMPCTATHRKIMQDVQGLPTAQESGQYEGTLTAGHDKLGTHIL